MPLLSPVVIKQEIDLGLLTSVSDRAGDLRPAWLRDVQPLITDFLTQRFNSEGAYLGAKWAPLSDATLALRTRPGHGRGGIGRDTNRLWASFVKSAGSAAAPGGTLLIAKDRYERGSSLEYARYFNDGYNSKTKPVFVETKQGPRWVFVRRKDAKQIPGRPIIPDPLPAQLVEQVELSLRAYVEGN